MSYNVSAPTLLALSSNPRWHKFAELSEFSVKVFGAEVLMILIALEAIIYNNTLIA